MTKRKTNPIALDKVAQSPHLLPYAHTLGSAIINPIDKGKIKGLAMAAMYEHTSSQLHHLKDQIEHLIGQAQDIHDRIDVSEKVYLADCNFQPVIGQTYHLFEKSDGACVLSMVSEQEWGDPPPYLFLATAKLLHDHTWDILEINKDKSI